MSNCQPTPHGARLPRLMASNNTGRPSLSGLACKPMAAPLMAMFLSALSACSTVTPLPEDPAAPLNLETLMTSQGDDGTDVPNWWTQFHSDELNQLVQQGLSNNYSLASAHASWQASRAVLASARADQSLTAEASLKNTQQWQPDHSNRWSLGAAASYELDFWGRLDGLSREAELSAQAQQAAMNTVANSVAAEVSLAWFGSAYQQQLLGLIEQQRERLQSSLKITNARFERGLVDVSDVWQQQQLLESLNADTLAAEANLRLYQQQLALWLADSRWLNRAQQQGAELNLADLLMSTALNKNAVPAIGVQQLQARPDVQQSWFALQASDAALAAAAANRYPRLTLSAGLEGSGTSLTSALDNWAANLAAGLVAPLLDGGSRKAEVERQQANRQAALADYRQTLLAAAQQVQGLLVEQQRLQQQQQSLQKQLDLARRTFEYQQARYRRGVGDFLATLSANQDVLSMEQSLLALQWQRLNNRIELYRSVSHGRFESSQSSLSSVPSTSGLSTSVLSTSVATGSNPL